MERLTRHVFQHALPEDADETNVSNVSASDHLAFSVCKRHAGVLDAVRKELSLLRLDTRCLRACCGSTTASTTKVGGYSR